MQTKQRNSLRERRLTKSGLCVTRGGRRTWGCWRGQNVHVYVPKRSRQPLFGSAATERWQQPLCDAATAERLPLALRGLAAAQAARPSSGALLTTGERPA